MPLITRQRSAVLNRALPGIARNDGALVHAVGVMPDHIHIALSIPPRIAVATVIRNLKGSSSHLLNHEEFRGDAPEWLGWQAEYGVLTFGERSLPTVVNYLETQDERHAARNLLPLFEITDTEPQHPENRNSVRAEGKSQESPNLELTAD